MDGLKRLAGIALLGSTVMLGGCAVYATPGETSVAVVPPPVVVGPPVVVAPWGYWGGYRHYRGPYYHGGYGRGYGRGYYGRPYYRH